MLSDTNPSETWGPAKGSMISRGSASGISWRITKVGNKMDNPSASRAAGDLGGKMRSLKHF